MIIEMLRKGDFNHLRQVIQEDGSRLFILTRRDDPHKYELLARDLYKSTEQILSQKIDSQEVKP
ncbi:MAG: hypothetical protein M0R06_06495 [Sphaerochaeta sp.]|jgi:hypothetical protein|nr:hypothetical protein [Sphaerochaeta sp.]MDD4985138.1 hypothetical protein [Dehalococcoidales bacterium]